MIDPVHGTPIRDIVAGAKVAVGCRNAHHACRMRGDDVALVVADVQAIFGRDTDQVGRMQQGRGVRLGMRRRVAADNAAGARVDTGCMRNRHGEPRGFIGDDSPRLLSMFKCGDDFVHTVEPARVYTDCCVVGDIKFFTHWMVVRVFRRHVESGHKHAACAARYVRAHRLCRERRHAAPIAHRIDSYGHIGRGVSEGTVEIEQDGADHAAQRRTVLTTNKRHDALIGATIDSRLGPSPAVVGEGWDGGIFMFAIIASEPPFPRGRGKEPARIARLSFTFPRIDSSGRIVEIFE